MKKTLMMSMALGFVFACGSSGSNSSYSDIKGKFDNPTGELAKDNVKSVAAALAAKLSENLPMVGALSAGLSVTGAVTDSAVNCKKPDMSGYTGGSVDITCTCSKGGNVTYSTNPGDYKGSANGGPCSSSYSYNSCKLNDGVIDGTGATYFASCGTTGKGMCFKFQGTANGQSVDVEYCLDENGEVWFLVEVAGGTYVVKGSYNTKSGNGDWYVKDKAGEWHCTSQNGSGSCEGPDSATVRF